MFVPFSPSSAFDGGPRATMTDYALRELEEAYEMDPSDSDVEDLPLCSKYVELTEDSDEAAQRRQSNRLNLDALSPEE